MDIKQRLEDAQLLIKNDRKTQILVGVVILMLLFLFFGGGTPKRGTKTAEKPKSEEQTSVAMGGKEAYEDLLKTFSGELSEIRTLTQTNSEDVQDLRGKMVLSEQRTGDIFKKILERINEVEAQGTSVAANQAYPEPVDATANAPIAEEPDDLESFGQVEQPQVGPPPAPPAQKLAVVGAGDSVRVKLLAGVNAPTDGTPYPVVFQLSGDVYGPDGSALPLGEARLIAAAQGSLSDQRALFRLTTLNLRLPNGQRKVMNVDGWVVGEDGVRGMPGMLIDPIGKLVGAEAVAGGIQGIGQGLSAAQLEYNDYRDGGTSVQLNGNVAAYALGQAAEGAANEYSNLIKSRISELVPHVRVLSGREGTAVFSQSFTIPGLLDQLEDGADQYASLD